MRRLLVSLLMGWCLAAMFSSAPTAEAQHASRSASDTCGDSGPPCGHPSDPPLGESLSDPPGLSGPPDLPQPRDDPAIPLQEQLDRSLRRAEGRLDDARRRLTHAESDRAVARGRRLRLLQMTDLRRKRASRLRRRAAAAQRRASAAEKQMVDERRNALEQVQAGRAAYNAELLDWFGSRVSALALAVWLLLMASLAACWRPLLAWLALRRARGLDRAVYARAVAVAAATVAGGAAAASAFSPALAGVLAPMAFPVIAAIVMLLGLTAWRSTEVKGDAAGVPAALTDRRLGPGVAVVLTLVTGVGTGLIALAEGEPVEPRVPPKTATLARLAEPDPTARPTERVTRLREAADRADSRARQADAGATTAEDMLRNSEENVGAVDQRASQARRTVEVWRQRVDHLRRD